MDKTYSAWHAVFAPVAYAVAGLMALAGLYLLDPQSAPLGFDLRAEQTWLAGVFLIYAALVLGLGTVRPKLSFSHPSADFLLTMLSGSLALLAVGVMSVALGMEALFKVPRNDWLALLLVPGALALIAMYVRDKEDAAEKAAAEDAASNIDADSGKAAPKGTTVTLMIFGAVYAVYMFVMFSWLVLLMWLYFGLRFVLFDGGTFAFADFWARAGGLIVAIGPQIAFWSVFVAVVVVAVAFATVLLQRLSMWGAKDANRDLNPAEIAFINDSAARVRAYAVAQGYDKGVWRLQAFYVVCLLVIMLGLGWLFFVMRPEAADTGPSFPIVISTFGASAIVLLFAGIFLSVLPNAVMTRLLPRYAERSGWIGLGEKNAYFTLEGHLTSRLRAGRLNPTVPLDPAHFLRNVNFAFEPYFLYPGVALLALGGFLTHRDLNTDDTLTATHIDVVDYWTTATTRYRYSDVERVVVSCYLTDKGETSAAYELHFRDGRSLDIYTKDHEVRQKFEAYEAIDGMLRQAGVPFAGGVRGGLFKGGESAYEPACVERVAEAYPVEMQDRVRALFDIDQGG